MQDLELDGTGDHVYALTPKKLQVQVVKIRVRQCGGSGDCRSCLDQRDPYCGWCVLNNACVPESNCTKSIPSTAHDWLTYQNGRCPAYEFSLIFITSASFLNVELENLPNLGGSLSCIFDFGSARGSVVVDAEPNGDQDNRIKTLNTAAAAYVYKSAEKHLKMRVFERTGKCQDFVTVLLRVENG
ncbi:unnamed protein product [Gongylonema pulchrum]|uniref:PSI domain-containing protein n=1 Tax=Gongylonema pulchrum TaxID=637853 RepID=A0A3P6STB1_9BILA|nr:unnamed protein product [Gongylonema pulchrum]